MHSILSRPNGFKIIRLILLCALLIGAIDFLRLVADSLLWGGLYHLPKHETFKDTVTALPSDVQQFFAVPAYQRSRKVELPDAQSDPYDALFRAPDIYNNQLEKKTLIFDVGPAQISARYEIQLPKEHPLLQSAQSRNALDKPALLVTDVLGVPLVNGSPLEFDSLEIALNENDKSAQLALTSKPLSNNGSNRFDIAINFRDFFRAQPAPPHYPLAAGQNEIVFRTTEAQVSADELLPVARSTELTRYSFAPAQQSASFTIITAAAPPGTSAEQTIADYMSKVITIPVLGTFIYGFYQSLPYLLFLFGAQRYAANVEAEQTRARIARGVAAVKLYLVFHAGYFLLLLFNEAYDEWANPVVLAINKVQRTHPLPLYSGGIKATYLLLLFMLLVLYLWPARLRRWEESTAARAARSTRLNNLWRGVSFIVLLALCGWTAWQWVVVAANGFMIGSLGQFYSSYGSLLLLCLFGLCVWLAHEVLPVRCMSGALACFALLLLLVVLDVETLRYWPNLLNSGPVYILAALSLVSAFSKLIYDLLTGQPALRFWGGLSRLKRLGLFLLLLLVVVSSRSWQVPVVWWPLWSLGAELKDLFTLAFGWLLVTLLRQFSTTYWPRLPDHVRYTGVLLAIIFFFPPATSWWFYVPVTTIAGYLLLEYWLLSKREYQNDLIARVKKRMGVIISNTIEFNETDRLLQLVKKEMPEQVGKGEVEYLAYKKRLKEIARDSERQRRRLLIHRQSAREVVLSFGPTDSPFRNGQIGAGYSLLLSIPWLLLYLRSIVTAPAPTSSYFLLTLSNMILSYLATWTAYGYFFGYFYPYILGHNGIKKGFRFFLMLLLPALLTTALSAPTDKTNWLSFAFWQLQVLIHMILLGFIAGDYETLRRARSNVSFRFKHLLQFYRLTYLSAWASALVVALGAAVTTLVASGATEVLSLALKQMGLLPQGPILPTK